MFSTYFSYFWVFVPSDCLHPCPIPKFPACGNHTFYLFFYECLCFLLKLNYHQQHYVSCCCTRTWFYIPTHFNFNIITMRVVVCLVTKSYLTLATPCHTPLSMGFFRQEYWSGLTFPSSIT